MCLMTVATRWNCNTEVTDPTLTHNRTPHPPGRRGYPEITSLNTLSSSQSQLAVYELSPAFELSCTPVEPMKSSSSSNHWRCCSRRTTSHALFVQELSYMTESRAGGAFLQIEIVGNTTGIAARVKVVLSLGGFDLKLHHPRRSRTAAFPEIL